jgi:serine/threonine-protein phosphatase PGAM5
VAKRTIYLIRHGQYANKSHDDELGGILTDLGREQAQYAGAFLSHMDISAIHCSSMRRAEETADIIASMIPNIEPDATDLLWELVPTIPPHLEAYFEALAERNPQFRAEQVNQKRDVADKAFKTFFHPPAQQDDQIAIVCHGNLIRYLVCQALGVNPDKWSNMLINHCSVTSIVVEEDAEMILGSYNETGHLPLPLKTER